MEGGFHTVSRNRKSIPVFAKQGAIIPRQVAVGNASVNPAHLILDVFNNGNGSYCLYEDDGESTDYMEGKGSFTTFELQDDLFIIHPVEDETAWLPEQRTYTVYFRCGISGAEVSVNGENAAAQLEGNNVTIRDVKPADRVEIRLKQGG